MHVTYASHSNIARSHQWYCYCKRVSSYVQRNLGLSYKRYYVGHTIKKLHQANEVNYRSAHRKRQMKFECADQLRLGPSAAQFICKLTNWLVFIVQRPKRWNSFPCVFYSAPTAYLNRPRWNFFFALLFFNLSST